MALVKLDFDGFVALENRLKLQTFYTEDQAGFGIYMLLEGQVFGTNIGMDEIRARFGTSRFVVELFRSTYIRDAVRIESVAESPTYVSKGGAGLDLSRLEGIIRDALKELTDKLTTAQSGGAGTAGYALLPVVMGSGKARRCEGCGNILLSGEEKCPSCGSERISDKGADMDLLKFVGWDFSSTVKWMLEFLKAYALTQITDVTDRQRESIRSALISSITEGWTLNKLEAEIEAVVGDGARARTIARTEVIRTANEGALLHYKAKDVEKVRWLAVPSAPGGRTCDRCLERNGKEYLLKDATGLIPLHTFCRCTWTPIIS